MHEVERVAWTPEQRDLHRRIAAHPFERADHALDFTQRLARDRGWSLAFARGAVAEYRRFCFLAMVFDTPVTPSEEVDEVWHQHLTYSRDYWEVWCGSVLRRPLHHDPTAGGPSEQGRYRLQYAETLARYEAFFGPPDPRFWPATHRRFRNGPRYRIVDGDRVWTLRRPACRGWLGRAATAIGLAFAGLGALPQPASALPLDPLDWTADPFLTLYAGLVAGAVLVALVLRSALSGGGGTVPARDLDVVEIAYLAGGSGRATDAVILGLIDHGAARFSAGSGHVTVADRGIALPPVLARYRGLAEGTVPRATLSRALRPHIEAVRTGLVARGLVPGREILNRIRFWTLATVAPVVLFGLAKMAVGTARGKPVGYLFLLIVVLVVLTTLILSMRPSHTRTGIGVLAGTRERHARAARAPRQGELLFAFALGGAAVLAGTPYEAYARYAQGMNGGSSSGDGGGGGGGDGGGSSGCGGGGGCGGCGS